MNNKRKEAIAKNSLRYYREHREEINKKRRERHATDEEYREKINRQKRESRKRCKERQQQELERYKNIIDELEKWLEKQYQDTENCFMFDKDLKSKYKRDLLLFSMCLDKLKELKGE